MSHRLACPLLMSLAVFPAFLAGQKKDRPYSELPVIQKKDQEESTQALPLPKEPPVAVVADTGKLVFSTVPLNGRGLLSQQTREALRTLVRNKGGVAIVKLRAFVAGSGDVRRIQEIAGEVFGEKRQNLPALSVIQVGSLPLDGAQISLEVIGLEKKTVNPAGLGFFSAQQGSSVADATNKVKDALVKAGLDATDAVRVTCFVNSLDGAGDWHSPLSGFSSAAINVVQMMREPVGPAAACEAVARLRTAPNPQVKFLDSSPDQSVAALVNTPTVVLTGIQMAFGRSKDDVRQGYERLNRVLSSMHTDFAGVVSSHTYLLFSSVAEPSRAVRAELGGKSGVPASTTLPFEGLASLDATMGIDVVAAPPG